MTQAGTEVWGVKYYSILHYRYNLACVIATVWSQEIPRECERFHFVYAHLRRLTMLHYGRRADQWTSHSIKHSYHFSCKGNQVISSGSTYFPVYYIRCILPSIIFAVISDTTVCHIYKQFHTHMWPILPYFILEYHKPCATAFAKETQSWLYNEASVAFEIVHMLFEQSSGSGKSHY